MKIFAIREGIVSEARVTTHKLSGVEISIPVISIGETGRSRKLGIIPIELLPDQKKVWEEKGEVGITDVIIGSTKKGLPKLISVEPNDTTDNENVICVLNTPIGFRGGNNHTGDRVDLSSPEDFHPFPGEILVEGRIAQGDAGRMGSGYQYVAKLPKGVVFRTRYYGRLYGNPPSHYYMWDGKTLLSVTWKEREISDIF